MEHKVECTSILRRKPHRKRRTGCCNCKLVRRVLLVSDADNVSVQGLGILSAAKSDQNARIVLVSDCPTGTETVNPAGLL